MPCVNEEEAIKAAKKEAFGVLSSLRRPDTVAVRIGEDWLVGFVSAKHQGDVTKAEIKWVYVDCKGVALNTIPSDVNDVLGQISDSLHEIIKRELESRVRK